MEGTMGESSAEFYTPDRASIEGLRSILEAQTGITVPYDDAVEISAQLLSLYECLARDHSNIGNAGDDR